MESARTGDISYGRYLREVFAIAQEQADHDREKLFETQLRQQEKLKEMKAENARLIEQGEEPEINLEGVDFVQIFGQDSDGNLVGIDAIKAQLIGSVTDMDSLNVRVQRIAEYVEEHGNPFSVREEVAPQRTVSYKNSSGRTLN